jgi:hypothetical protein
MAYTPNFRAPRLPYGNLVPGWTHSASDRPHSDVTPAAWLPVNGSSTNQALGFFSFDDGTQNGDIMVIMAGKLVSLTRETLAVTNFGTDLEKGPVGRAVPAGVRVAWAAAGGSDDVLEYTSVDVEERIEDLATGLPVAAAVTYNKDELTAALQTRGLLRSSESLEDFLSAPVGVLAVNAYAWAGGDGLQPRGYRKHNYKRQHKVNLLCDWVLRLAHVPVDTGDLDVPAISTLLVTAAATAALQLPRFEDGTPRWIAGATGIPLSLADRYTETTGDWVGLVVGRRRIEHSLQAPIAIRDAGSADVTDSFFVSRKSSLADVAALGDYYLDLEMGVIFFYEDGGNALPVGYDGTAMSTDFDIEFSYHTAHAEQLSPYPGVVGDVRPGDFLVCDLQSNFRKYSPAPDVALDLTAVDVFVAATSGGAVTTAATVWTASVAADETTAVDHDTSVYDRPEDIVAQVLTMSRFPSEDMAITKTFWENMPNGLKDRTPGSATRGYSDRLTYARGGQFEVLVNLMK